MAVREEIKPEAGQVVDMAWDPITRIVGNLGIYTKIDFKQKEVVSCKSTSSMFRGYSVFMKGKDPRDAHFITSRICGICGDNHAVCSQYAQNMAYGVKTPAARRVDREPRRGGRVRLRPHDLPGQPGLRGLLRADGQGDQSERAREGREGRGPARRRARVPHDRRHHALVQPVHGRDLPRGARDEPHHARDDLPDGGAPRAPLDDLPRRGGHGGHADAVHRLPDPAAALPRLHQEGRGDERRRVRLLLRGPAGLRGGRPAPRAAGLLGRLQQPRARGLRLPQHGRLGQRDVRDPGSGGGRRARDHEPRGHQPRHQDPAGQLVLRGLGERGDLRREGSRSGTRSTGATPGTRRRSPSRRSAISRAATTRG